MGVVDYIGIFIAVVFASVVIAEEFRRDALIIARDQSNYFLENR